MVLEKPEGMGNISQLKFNKVELWIQIHDVPIIGMNRRSAKWMAEQIGRVIEIPIESKDCWGKFIKVKVQIDITKPLKRWLRLKLDKSDVIVMVSLKYERLPEFCYFCGRIGHASKECSDEEAKLEAMKGVSTKYGSWMRSSVPDRQKMRTDQQNDGILKIQGRLEERREGKEVVMQKLGSGSIRCEENEGGQQNLSSELMNFQVKNLTDSVSDQKEATNFPTTNILAKFNGSGSSNSDGLMIEGPSEKEKSERKKLVEEGKEEFGPGSIKSNPNKDGLGPDFNMDGPNIGESKTEETSLAGQSQAEIANKKKSNTRNWKRLARANKTEIISCNQPNFFHNLQMSLVPRPAGNYDWLKLEHSGFGESSSVLGLEEVDCIGCSGGLMVLWKKELQVTVISYSVGHIDARIKMEDGFRWRFSGVYGNPSPNKRVNSWELLGRLSEVDRFRQAIDKCDLIELGSSGPRYTWNNKREGKFNIQERIDRFFANNLWRDRFEFVMVEHLGFNSSDHRPILLKFD
ncbi:hypothetical protein EZV62_024151 [Acer yangbiense]|uniref:CCHC-type domain-containing protein n=1 Tax=Acer yangbiense TaxID=1000413 RepID=A0A5C7H3Y3_9ROSI|nr:hypothetical protein EZV62_024151 [Acer yangbiense]